MVGFGFGKEAKSVTIETKLYFSNADSAEDAADIINGVIALLKSLISVPEAKDLLDKIKVGLNNLCVTTVLNTTTEEVINTVEAQRTAHAH